jgi:AsmA protein
LTGQLGVSNFADPAITFKLVLDEIDVDRYLPPASDKPATADSKPAAPAKGGDDKLPLDALRGINAKGTFDIGKLKISGTHSEKIHLELNANKGLIKLAPLSANMYQGQYNGNINFDARGKTLKLSLNESLKGVQVGPLLKDLSDSDILSGTANAQAKLTGNGATVKQIKATLSGNGNFSFTDGSINGVNIAESIRIAKAALGGKKVTSKEPVKTDFASLTGSFIAKNGVIDNQDLLVKSPLLRIDGAGKVDLPKEGLDYGLNVSIVGSVSGQGGEELADLKGLTIPVKITGTFDNPKPTVDLAGMLKDQATQEMKDKASEALKDKLGDDLGGLLGGMLGTEKSEPTTTEATESKATEEAKPKEPAKSAEDQAKDALKDKLKGFF